MKSFHFIVFHNGKEINRRITLNIVEDMENSRSGHNEIHWTCTQNLGSKMSIVVVFIIGKVIGKT